MLNGCGVCHNLFMRSLIVEADGVDMIPLSLIWGLFADFFHVLNYLKLSAIHKVNAPIS